MSRPDTSRNAIPDAGPESGPQAPVIRPKAYRRPPAWISPGSNITPEPRSKTSLTLHEPNLADMEDEIEIKAPAPAPRASEPAYGIALIIGVILVNLIIAFALSHIDRQVVKRNIAAAQPLETENTAAPAPAVTLFATPLSERRTARYPTGESTDVTDQITTYHNDNAVENMQE